MIPLNVCCHGVTNRPSLLNPGCCVSPSLRPPQFLCGQSVLLFHLASVAHVNMVAILLQQTVSCITDGPPLASSTVEPFSVSYTCVPVPWPDDKKT